LGFQKTIGDFRLVSKVDESVVCVFDTTFVENTSHMHCLRFWCQCSRNLFFLDQKNCFQYIWKVNPGKTPALSKSWVSKKQLEILG
jgi:uncharacterized protein YlbG (UPF0298 family)